MVLTHVLCVCASPPGVCPECYTANGEDYRGVQNRTSGSESGKACLYWNETFQHPYNTVKYPNGEGGLGPHNYCRWVWGLVLWVEWAHNWGPTAARSLVRFSCDDVLCFERCIHVTSQPRRSWEPGKGFFVFRFALSLVAFLAH